MTTVLIAGFFALAVACWGVLPGLVYRDANRLGLDEPEKWALIVGLSCGTGLPLYLFERDDARHDDEADPFTLPGGAGNPAARDDDERA